MKIILSIIVVLLLLFLFIRILEYKSLYFPFREIEITPEDVGLKYEDIHVKTEDGLRINGWFIPSNASKATILLSHGNGGNISHRIEKILILNALGIDVMIFDYRGYGMSEGSPSEKGLYKDIEAVYTYLVKEKKVSPDSIIGYGESLGGAVVIDLSSRHEMGGIIIEDTFTSVRDMARKYFPFIPSFLLKSSFDSLSGISSVRTPKLFFHSITDEIVPFEQGRRLYESASEPKWFVQLRGGHNDAFLVSKDIYSAEIGKFIERVR
jgi:fermentation-respiration switch protein FrsA (DUF1100 family)